MPPPPPPPVIFIAGRPKAALLFWFFGDFRCGALLFVLFTLYINTKIGEGGCKMLDWPVAACLGGCCSPGCRLWCLWWCLFVLSFFPRGVLNEIMNLIESVFEGFPSYLWKVLIFKVVDKR